MRSFIKSIPLLFATVLLSIFCSSFFIRFIIEYGLGWMEGFSNWYEVVSSANVLFYGLLIGLVITISLQTRLFVKDWWRTSVVYILMGSCTLLLVFHGIGTLQVFHAFHAIGSVSAILFLLVVSWMWD